MPITAIAFLLCAIFTTYQKPEIPTGQINVLAAGCVGDGKTDNAAILNNLFSTSPEGSCFYFPQGQYLITAPLLLNNHKNFSMVGDCTMSGGNFGSTILGNVAGNLVSADNGHGQTFQVSKINFVNSNPLPTSTAFYSSNANCSSWRDVSFSGSNGLWLNSPFSCTCDTVHFNGWGSKVSIGAGCMATGITNLTFTGCDWTAWNYGLVANNAGLNLKGGRFEVNHVAMALGVKTDMVTQDYLGGGGIEGPTFEANDIHILGQNVNNLKISGIHAQGSTNAPSGLSITGFQVHAANGLTIDSCNFGGAYSCVAWQIGDPVGNGALLQNTKFTCCIGNNGGSGKTVWNVTTPGCTWDRCDFRPDNRQNVPVTAGETSIVITLPTPQKTWHNVGQFSTFVMPSWNTATWVDGKTETQFVVHFSVPAPTGATLDWLIR